MLDRGDTRQALAVWRKGVRLMPDAVAILNELAWVLATAPDPALRNGKEAVALAQRAVEKVAEQAPEKEAGVRDTLAAAYAEAGRFPEAIKTAQEALKIAAAGNDPAMIEQIRRHLQLFQAGKPYRYLPRPPPSTPLKKGISPISM